MDQKKYDQIVKLNKQLTHINELISLLQKQAYETMVVITGMKADQDITLHPEYGGPGFEFIVHGNRDICDYLVMVTRVKKKALDTGGFEKISQDNCEHPFASVQTRCFGEINTCLKCGKDLSDK